MQFGQRVVEKGKRKEKRGRLINLFVSTEFGSFIAKAPILSAPESEAQFIRTQLSLLSFCARLVVQPRQNHIDQGFLAQFILSRLPFEVVRSRI